LPSSIQAATAAVSNAVERLGRHTVGRPVLDAIRAGAGATGIGFDVLAAKAAVESGFRPNAQARTSSARGLFQFIDQTWLDMVQRRGADHGLGEAAAAITRGPGGRLTVADPAERARILALRDDPEISTRMAGEYLKDIAETLTPVLGRRPDASELYLGHFLGAGGARQVLQGLARDPNQPASALLPDAAAANRRLFFDASGRPLSLSGFMQGIRTRLDRAYAEIGMTAPEGSIDFRSRAAQPARTGEEVGAGAVYGAPSNSTPARIAHVAEQAMFSAMARVFTRMGGRAPGEARREENPQALPAEVLAALRNDTRRADARS
jgi:hypothetical protein